jgi:hypothetical protein
MKVKPTSINTIPFLLSLGGSSILVRWFTTSQIYMTPLGALKMVKAPIRTKRIPAKNKKKKKSVSNSYVYGLFTTNQKATNAVAPANPKVKRKYLIAHLAALMRDILDSHYKLFEVSYIRCMH